MVEERIGYRYAKSVFDLAVEKGMTMVVNKDMDLIRQTCKDNAELLSFLKSPIIPSEKKQQVLEAIFAGQFQSELTPLLIAAIVRKNREMYLYYIATAFIKLYDAKFNISRGLLTTAEALTPEALDSIKSVIEEKTGNTFFLEEKVDAELIGGFILKIGDQLFDGSVSTALRKLRNEYDDNLYVKLY